MGEAAQTRTPETQLFHDVFNASPIGIAVENLEGQPLFVNPAFCSFLGFSEEELRNKHCVDFSPREDAEKDWALFQQLRAGSIDHYQLGRVHTNSTIFRYDAWHGDYCRAVRTNSRLLAGAARQRAA
jgi:PAS domain-containing protein